MTLSGAHNAGDAGHVTDHNLLDVAVNAAMKYKGAWSAATAYATNDVVSRAYALYVALTPGAAGVNDPAVPFDASAGATVAATTLGGTFYNDGNQAAYAVDFTPSSNMAVGGVIMYAQTNATDAIVEIGVANSSTSVTGVTPLAASSPVNCTGGTNATARAFPLLSVVNLVAGTTYRITMRSASGGSLGLNAAVGTTASITNGTIANPRYGSPLVAGNFIRMDLKGSASVKPWEKIGSTSNQESVNAVTASGATQTLPDVDTNSLHRIVLSANCTLTFPTAAAGKSFTLVLVQDATGSRTVTWPSTVKWAGGTAPTLTTTASKADVFTFLCADGTNWLGFTAGQAF